MELLANVSDPRIPLSILMLELSFTRARRNGRETLVIAAPRRLELAPEARETAEEPERWDGMS